MVAVKAGDVEGAVRRPDPRAIVFLVYGPDTGLVNERARRLAEASVEDPSDPFQLVRLDGDEIASDPSRLVDEAGTIGLFGARRALWVRAGARNIAPGIEGVIKLEPPDCAVIVEAGDLAKSSPLRSLCEKSPRARALPCYSDTDRDLGAIVDEMLKADGFSLSREARAAILASLGGDRLATRSEIAKLTSYAAGRGEITLEDVDAILSDVSGLAVDGVVDAAFAGLGRELETGLRRLLAEGTHGSVILGSALRHALALIPPGLNVEAGQPARAAVDGMRGLHFRRKALVERHLRSWSAQALKQAALSLQDAILQTRRLPALTEAIASRALLDIARAARR